MNWIIRGIALLGIIVSVAFGIRSCSVSTEDREIQERARSATAGIGALDPNSENTIPVRERDLAALRHGWRENYCAMPSIRLEWFVSCALSAIWFLLIGTMTFIRSSNKTPEDTAHKLADPGR